MHVRLTGLTEEEMAAIGDPETLAAAINAELDAFRDQVVNDRHRWYTDDEVHAIIDARLAALPEHGPERTAIQRTYELLLVIIDGGVADQRSDHELLYWIDRGEDDDHGFRPVAFI